MAKKNGITHNPTVAGLVTVLGTWGATKLDTIKMEWAWGRWIPDWLVQFGNWWGTPIGIKPYLMVWLALGAYILWRVAKKVAAAWSSTPPASSSPRADTPSWLSYTSEQFQGVNWEWRWVKAFDGKFDVSDIRPFCPKCRYPLVWSMSRYHALGYQTVICDACGFEHQFNVDNDEMEQRLRRRIMHVLREQSRQQRESGALTSS